MRKISLSNFTHLNKIKWRIFIPVQKAWYVKKIARGGWSGFGKALTWDPSQMITCHPKKIPKFLLKGGVVQFCQNLNPEVVLICENLNPGVVLICENLNPGVVLICENLNPGVILICENSGTLKFSAQVLTQLQFLHSSWSPIQIWSHLH